MQLRMMEVLLFRRYLVINQSRAVTFIIVIIHLQTIFLTKCLVNKISENCEKCSSVSKVQEDVFKCHILSNPQT